MTKKTYKRDYLECPKRSGTASTSKNGVLQRRQLLEIKYMIAENEKLKRLSGI